MTKTGNNSPGREKVDTQVVDIVESGNSPVGKNLQFDSALELIGAIKHQQRLNLFSQATLVIELSKVQAAYKGHGNLQLITEADSFKAFVEHAGINYKTIMNKISDLKAVGPQLLQMFEQLGVPVTLQRQIKALPVNLRKQLDDALAGSPEQSANKVAEVFKELTAHIVTIQDKLDESSTKTKVEVIDECDRWKSQFYLAEDRMIHMNEKNEKNKAKIKKLLASQQPDEKALGLRKINDQMEVFFKTLSGADLSGDDLAILTEKHKFQKLIDQAVELGIN